MIEINEYISYIESSDNPISSNVYFIQGKDNTYIFDVGKSDEAYSSIESIDRNKIVIISHFHEDHLSNINRITFNDLYVGNYTYKHTNKGNIVREKIVIEDGIKLEIAPISSVHSKGSLLLNINNEYCLIGDLVHSDKPMNKSLFCMMIKDLQNVDTKYFVMGHGNNCVIEKSILIDNLNKQIDK